MVEDVVVVYEAPARVSKRGFREGWGVCLPGLGTTASSSNKAADLLTCRIVMGGGRASPESNDNTRMLGVLGARAATSWIFWRHRWRRWRWRIERRNGGV